MAHERTPTIVTPVRFGRWDGATVEERFRAKIAVHNRIVVPELGPCSEWQAARDPKGYGRFGVARGRVVFAHRFALALEGVEVPDDALVCHHCDNPPCCEPAHLFVGDHAANMEDWRTKGYGQGPTCRRGHPWDEANTHVYTWRGYRLRRCRACDRLR